MKTSAISNPTNLASGTATAAKVSDAATDSPFSQMLSREMAAQPKASEPVKTDKTQSAKEPQAARPESEARETTSTEQSDANAAPESNSPPVKADKPAASTEAKPQGDKDQDDDVAVSTESEELLALVASLAQPSPKATDTEATADGEQAALDAADDGAKGDGQAKDLQLTAQTALPQNALEGGVTAQPGNQPTLARTEVPGQSLREFDSLHAAKTIAPRRGIDTGSVERRVASSTTEEPSTDPKAFDAKLAQASDEKITRDDSAGKTQPGRSEFVAPQASDRPASKPAQDVQQPIPTAFTMSAASVAQAQPAQAMAAQAANMLAPRVGSQGWDQALSQKVVWMVGSDIQSASLTLNPPDLGPLQVVLHVSENQATANFTAAQPEVRQALEAAMPKLREMLGDAGIQLSQANVNAGTPNGNPQNAFEQPQHSARQASTASNDSTEPSAVRTSRSQTITSREGMVDTFA